MLTPNSKKVLGFIKDHPGKSSNFIYENSQVDSSYATVKRILKQLINENLLVSKGKGRGTTYQVSESYLLLAPLNLDTYFEKEIDEREVKSSYNRELISTILPKVTLFTEYELTKLNNLQLIYRKNLSELTTLEYQKELERLAIDLSWKSAQIEGNTYSLLETERLLKEKETAQGKKKEEAVMLLNHKEALDFIIEEPKYIDPLSTSGIEDIHSLLMKELGGRAQHQTKACGYHRYKLQTLGKRTSNQRGNERYVYLGKQSYKCI